MLVLGLCCFIAAAVVGLDALLWFGVLLIALPVVCAAYVLPARCAEHVARSLEPEVARVGMPVQVTVYATVRTTLPTAAGRWFDTLPPGIAGAPSGMLRGLGSGLRGAAQTLTLRHDTFDRDCYMPGVLLAVKAVGNRPGVTRGLDQLLDL